MNYLPELNFEHISLISAADVHRSEYSLEQKQKWMMQTCFSEGERLLLQTAGILINKAKLCKCTAGILPTKVQRDSIIVKGLKAFGTSERHSPESSKIAFKFKLHVPNFPLPYC